MTRAPLGRVRRRHRHDAPAESCSCGIYATSPASAQEYLAYALPDALIRVLGRVSLWGDVVECDSGFRGSHGYPLELYLSPRRVPARLPLSTVRRELGSYGVPLHMDVLAE